MFRCLVLGIALLCMLATCTTEKENPRVKLIMENGDEILIELYAKESPKTVENFLKLINEKFYDGLTFHRVEPGILVQGGDPNGDGTGNSGSFIKFEENKLKHMRGTLAMARGGEKDSASCQFYIMMREMPELDGNYCVFGQVTGGMESVDRIKIKDKIKYIIQK